MNGLYQNILELIGRTPILPLNRVVPDGSGTVLIKLENHNPSGSVKDRVALALVEDAEGRGQVTPGGHLVYATSGNSGVALAMVAAGRFGRPEEVGDLICFLASERAGFITGQSIAIDGGQLRAMS